MMLKVARLLLAPVAAAVLAACAVGPNYHAPETKVAEKFDGIETATYSPQENVEQFWRTFTAQRDRQAIRHDVARRLLARYPADAQSLPELTARLAPEIERADQASRQIADSAEGFVSFVIATSVALVTALLMIGHIVSSLLVPGGVVTRFNGLAMVTADGHPLSRARSLCRVLLAWSPALLWFIALAASRRTLDGIPLPPSPMLLLALTYLLLAAGAIATVVHPRRGPHDTLARTWVIPR